MTLKHRFYKGRALDQELRSIYEERGKLPDMSRLEHEYHRRTTRILIGLVSFFALLTAASWTGLFLFGPTRGGGGEVEMKVTGPEAVVSGTPQEIVIHYKNRDRHPLAFGALRLRLPESVVVKEATPAPTEQGRLEWNFGTLPAKVSGEIRLLVIPYGVIDQTLEIQPIFSYKPANFNAEFQTLATHIFTIRASAISIAIEGPAETTPGQEIALTAKFKNESDETFEKLQASLTLPPTFTLAETEPKSENSRWDLGTLAPNGEQSVTFKGSFLSAAQGPQEMTLQIGVASQGDTLYPLAAQTHTVEVKGAHIQIELLINESPDQQWVRLGQVLRLKTKLTNRTDKPIEGLRVQIPVNGTLVNWAETKAEDGSTTNAQLLTFPESGTFAIEPQKQKDLFATLAVAPSGAQTASPFIELHAEVIQGDTILRSPSLKLIVVSDLALTTEARYFGADGSLLGAGPLPPKVGEETRFTIRLRLKNTFHDLSSIVATAMLPPEVRWTGATRVSAGKLTFNDQTREVRFEIPRMTIATGDLTAQFEVGATPQESDRGQLLLLLGVSRVEALDTIAQVTFSADAPSVSSLLESDPSGRGKGVVQ